VGLAIARQIVEAHGGRIEVGESASGGARFMVILPALERATVAA
jgi:signal transduction histidine kinase